MIRYVRTSVRSRCFVWPAALLKTTKLSSPPRKKQSKSTKKSRGYAPNYYAKFPTMQEEYVGRSSKKFNRIRGSSVPCPRRLQTPWPAPARIRPLSQPSIDTKSGRKNRIPDRICYKSKAETRLRGVAYLIGWLAIAVVEEAQCVDGHLPRGFFVHLGILLHLIREKRLKCKEDVFKRNRTVKATVENIHTWATKRPNPVAM